MKTLLQKLPAIHMVQNEQRFADLIEKHDITLEAATKIAQKQTDTIRKEMIDGRWTGPDTKEELIDYLLAKLESELVKETSSLRAMINATGVILHTNLGRARLSEPAIEQMTKVARHYSNLEYDIGKGERGSRHSLVEEAICELTGAEAAMVVNNNAAAVFLTLNALARDKEVIVSRGELVEIGGSFRVSSIMEESGARLKEVGTTNKTHLSDYERAIDESTAMLMKVHTSNFRMIGFTKSVASDELVKLAAEHDRILTYEDLGSGALIDLKSKGIGSEPVVKDVIGSGVDVVTFSGDKLLGGPQAGIIAGKSAIINRLKKHQLARVLRVDKFTLAALEATLKAYRYEQFREIPTLRDILATQDEILAKAERFMERIDRLEQIQSSIEEEVSRIGGGTMPEVELPTYGVSIRHRMISVEQLARSLRESDTPIIGRIKEDGLLLDFRTVTDDEMDVIVDALKTLVGK